MPPCQQRMDQLVAEHAPTAAHYQYSGHIFEVESASDLFSSGMFPEVRMHRNAGDSNFVYRYATKQ
ncbi:hypothetical protein D3C74_480810 [compost metagenome]